MMKRLLVTLMFLVFCSACTSSNQYYSAPDYVPSNKPKATKAPTRKPTKKPTKAPTKVPTRIIFLSTPTHDTYTSKPTPMGYKKGGYSKSELLRAGHKETEYIDGTIYIPGFVYSPITDRYYPINKAAINQPQQQNYQNNKQEESEYEEEPAIRSGSCDPNYSGACVPIVSYDLDCPDVGVRGFSRVGSDIHGFDRDGDGVCCETYK